MKTQDSHSFQPPYPLSTKLWICCPSQKSWDRGWKDIPIRPNGRFENRSCFSRSRSDEPRRKMAQKNIWKIGLYSTRPLASSSSLEWRRSGPHSHRTGALTTNIYHSCKVPELHEVPFLKSDSLPEICGTCQRAEPIWALVSRHASRENRNISVAHPSLKLS